MCKNIIVFCLFALPTHLIGSQSLARLKRSHVRQKIDSDAQEMLSDTTRMRDQLKQYNMNENIIACFDSLVDENQELTRKCNALERDYVQLAARTTLMESYVKGIIESMAKISAILPEQNSYIKELNGAVNKLSVHVYAQQEDDIKPSSEKTVRQQLINK